MLVLAATAIAGGSAYIANALVGATSSAADYAVFGVFWSALYLVIAALSGIQQEIARATRPVTAAGPSEGIRRFALLAAAAAMLIVAASSPLWIGAIDGGSGGPWLLPILVGAGGYVVVTVVVGVLYGLELWVPIALMSSVDGLLRLVLILIVLSTGADQGWLAWAVVAPFPLTPLLLWLTFRRRVAGRFVLDVRLPALARNSVRSVGATIATGVLISGFPLVLALVASEEPAAELGAVVLAINLVRAPLVIVVLSLQSFFVVRFRSLGGRASRLFIRIGAAILAATALLAIAAFIAGPPIITLLWPQYDIDVSLIVGLVVASGLLGVLCVSGPLVLARGDHGQFFAGWAIAAAVTVGLLLVPLPLESRVLLALGVAPIVGAAVHLAPLPQRRPAEN
jgi:hypothetical protein